MHSLAVRHVCCHQVGQLDLCVSLLHLAGHICPVGWLVKLQKSVSPRPPPPPCQQWLESHPRWGKAGDPKTRVSLAALEKLIDRLEKESGKLGSAAEISQVCSRRHNTRPHSPPVLASAARATLYECGSSHPLHAWHWLASRVRALATGHCVCVCRRCLAASRRSYHSRTPSNVPRSTLG